MADETENEGMISMDMTSEPVDTMVTLRPNGIPTYQCQSPAQTPISCTKKYQPMQTFCGNTSLRGFPKLIKHKYNLLRFLWITFIVSMSIILLVGVINLLVRYKEYGTMINTVKEHTAVAEFPSVTVCNQHPYGKNAEDLWSSGILSPRDFSKNIRTAIRKLIHENRLGEAQQLFNNDRKTSYFETIGLQKSGDIGHAENAILYCLLKLKSGIRVGHNDECGIKIQRFQHPQFFNCYTLNILPEFSREAVSLGIIIYAGSEVRMSNNMDNSLIQDAFSQAHGTRVTLHEPQTYPDPIGNGLNLETGMFTDLTYTVNKWNKVNTPKHQCIKSIDDLIATTASTTQNDHVDESGCYIITDHVYNYTESLCQQVFYSQLIADECKCLSGFYPMADSQKKKQGSYPFCHKIDFNDLNATSERLSCFQRIYNTQIVNMSAEMEGRANCESMCITYTYDVHMSMSRWISVDWQLYWLVKLSDAWQDLKSAETYQSAIQTIDNFASIDSAVNDTHSNSIQIDNLNISESVFFMVTRTDFLTTLKLETLSVTTSALLSQIGGMSSLTIGITFATFVELIEFFYLLYTKRKT